MEKENKISRMWDMQNKFVIFCFVCGIAFVFSCLLVNSEIEHNKRQHSKEICNIENSVNIGGFDDVSILMNTGKLPNRQN